MNLYKSQNFQELSQKTVRLFLHSNAVRKTIDGIQHSTNYRQPHQSSIQRSQAIAAIPNFVLVGNSYTVINSVQFSNKYIDDIVDISNLFFSDAQTYITFILSRSRSVYVCFYALATSFSRSSFVTLYIQIIESVSQLAQHTPLVQDTLIASLDAILNRIERHGDFVLSWYVDDVHPILVDLCISALKLIKQIWHTVLAITAAPAIAYLGMSIISIPVAAASEYAHFADKSQIAQPQTQTITSTLTNVALQPLAVADSVHTHIDFTALKYDLASRAQQDIYAKQFAKELQYTVVQGDTLDNLAQRWNTTREHIALSNLQIPLYGQIPAQFIGSTVFIPKQEHVVIVLNTDVTIITLAQVLGVTPSSLQALQQDTSRDEYTTGDTLSIPFPDLGTGITTLETLVNNSYIADPHDTISHISSDLQAKIQIIQNEEVRAQAAAAEEAEKARIQAEEAEKAQQEQQAMQAQSSAQAAFTNTSASPAAAPQITTSTTMVWPSTGRLSRCNISGHLACDIANKVGTPIVAFRQGTVIYAGWKNGGFGNMIEIDHGNGLTSIYMHLSSISVRAGQAVVAGEYLGGMGSTGNSTGSHLHFGVFVNGIEISPFRYLTWK